MRSGSLCKRNKTIIKTDDPRSILDQNQFEYLHELLQSISTFGLGCWTSTTSKTIEKRYFVKMDYVPFPPPPTTPVPPQARAKRAEPKRVRPGPWPPRMQERFGLLNVENVEKLKMLKCWKCWKCWNVEMLKVENVDFFNRLKSWK